MKFITKLLDTFDPYIREIQDPMIKDIARVVMPAVAGILFVWLVSLPFTLVSEIVQGVVTIATKVQ